MGKRHRESRTALKRVLRRFGVRETELGEIREDISKAEARRRLLRRQEVQDAILARAVDRARQEIYAQEDQRVFHILDQVFHPSMV